MFTNPLIFSQLMLGNLPGMGLVHVRAVYVPLMMEYGQHIFSDVLKINYACYTRKHVHM